MKLLVERMEQKVAPVVEQELGVEAILQYGGDGYVGLEFLSEDKVGVKQTHLIDIRDMDTNEVIKYFINSYKNKDYLSIEAKKEELYIHSILKINNCKSLTIRARTISSNEDEFYLYDITKITYDTLLNTLTIDSYEGIITLFLTDDYMTIE